MKNFDCHHFHHRFFSPPIKNSTLPTKKRKTKKPKVPLSRKIKKDVDFDPLFPRPKTFSLMKSSLMKNFSLENHVFFLCPKKLKSKMITFSSMKNTITITFIIVFSHFKFFQVKNDHFFIDQKHNYYHFHHRFFSLQVFPSQK
jgi:hypothetical protein